MSHRHLATFIFIVTCPTIGFSASFDCNKATTRTEKLICSDSSLSVLDEKLASTYINAQRATANREGVRNEQRKWLREVRDACPDVNCLLNAYRDRIVKLEGGMSVPAGLRASGSDLTGVYKSKAGELNILALPGGRFRFQVVSMWKTNILDVSGEFQVLNDQASYIDKIFNCRLDFTFKPRLVSIKEDGSCGGLNATATGDYKLVPGQKPKVEQ